VALLPSDRDKSKIPHGRAIGLRIPIDHNGAQSAAGTRQGCRQANDAGADHREIKSLR
jgi:hypothetical protein